MLAKSIARVKHWLRRAPFVHLSAARELCKSGIEQTVVTLGRQGTVFVSADGSWAAQPPEIQIVSSVGSGDAFLGGLVLSFQKVLPLTLHCGMQSPLALLMCFVQVGRFVLADFEAMYMRVQISVRGCPKKAASFCKFGENFTEQGV